MSTSALSLGGPTSASLINRPASPAGEGSNASRRNYQRLSLSLDTNERAQLLPPAHHMLSVHIDRPSTPGIAQKHWLSHPITSTEQEYANVDTLPLTPGGSPSFTAQPRGGPIPAPTLFSRIRLFFLQLFTNALSTFFLVGIVIWALSSRSIESLSNIGHWSNSTKRSWDEPEKWKNEQLTKDLNYYAEACGYHIIEQTVETEDGYYLKVHKVVKPGPQNQVKADGRGGWPVIIQHGLFQTSGSFVTSEERSLAFWLVEHGGYQVYLSNSRAVFDMGHRTLSRSDPRFWDYNIREMALYDLPAVIAHVKHETSYDKVAFIGHSQGNATMFCTLARGMFPQIGESLSVFIALAPAVYAGPLTTGFPFGLLKNMEWKTWKRIFGVLDFIPMMRYAYNLTPGRAFGLLGYQMFAFLFTWTDKGIPRRFFCFMLAHEMCDQLKRRKAKMFRFTPSPVSSASIFWWTGKNGFSTRGCALDQKVTRWFDKSFPPLSLYHGGMDYLVLIEPLLARLQDHESEHVKIIRVDRLETGEHCDTFWHVDAPELTYASIIADIESTRDLYPEEVQLKTA